jgi:hypothetical protein
LSGAINAVFSLSRPQSIAKRDKKESRDSLLSSGTLTNEYAVSLTYSERPLGNLARDSRLMEPSRPVIRIWCL